MTDRQFGSERPREPARRKSGAKRSANPDFDNQSFWETRYTTDLDTGSGPGSRGRFLEYKQQLLDRLIAEFNPTSILDAGCGDIEVTKELDFSGAYTGIDLSPSIIARNRRLRPDWTFTQGDFLDVVGRDGLRADLVLGFDVLIHQHDEATYRSFVRALINAADKVAVINGYETRGGSGSNTAFHEPLTQTIAEVGTARVRLGDRFRKTQIVLIEKDEVVDEPAVDLADSPSA